MLILNPKVFSPLTYVGVWQTCARPISLFWGTPMIRMIAVLGCLLVPPISGNFQVEFVVLIVPNSSYPKPEALKLKDRPVMVYCKTDWEYLLLGGGVLNIGGRGRGLLPGLDGMISEHLQVLRGLGLRVSGVSQGV